MVHSDKTWSEAGEIRKTADRRVGETLASADAALETAEDCAATAAGTGCSPGHAPRYRPHGGRPASTVLGLVAAGKVTAGETAQTMRDVRSAVPNFIAQGQRHRRQRGHGDREFSGVATNLNRITKPKWYDRLLGYGLSFGALPGPESREAYITRVQFYSRNGTKQQ